MESKLRELFNAFRPFLTSKARAFDTGTFNLKVNDDIIYDQKLVLSQFVNYFTELGHVDEGQREELKSLYAHRCVGVSRRT